MTSSAGVIPPQPAAPATVAVARKEEQHEALPPPQWDAIVVGTGLAGLTVALQTLDRGGRVVLLEKEASMGGNSIKASSGINAAPAADDIEAMELFRQDTLQSAGDLARPELIDTLVSNSPGALRWLQERLEGVDLSAVGQLGGHSVPRTHRPTNGVIGYTLISALKKALAVYQQQQQPPRLEILLQSKVSKLCTDPITGAVTGVEYTSSAQDNTENSAGGVLSGTSVILATGGFASDRSPGSLLASLSSPSAPQRPQQEHQPASSFWNYCRMPTTGGPFATGDGIRLATSHLAATNPSTPATPVAGVTDLDCIQIHPTGWVDQAEPTAATKILAAELMRGVGGILLDPWQGRRFCNELGTRAYVVQCMQEQIMLHDDKDKYQQPTFYLLFSSAAIQEAGVHAKFYRHKGLITHMSGGIQALAEWMQVPKENLQQTLQEYLQAANKGQDAFGKTVFRNVPGMVKAATAAADDDADAAAGRSGGDSSTASTDTAWMEKEEFYVGKVTPVLHYCMGGLTIDSKGRVLQSGRSSSSSNMNKDMEEQQDQQLQPAVIPGLYAVGEVTGGVHGANRLGGNSLLECTVFGSIIGKQLPILSSTTNHPPTSTRAS